MQVFLFKRMVAPLKSCVAPILCLFSLLYGRKLGKRSGRECGYETAAQ